MSLTAHSTVIRRLVVSPGPATVEREPVVASAAGISAVLRAFGRPPAQLPVRTVVYIGGTAPEPGLPTEHEGFTVRTAGSPGRALSLAHQELHDGTADFALVAGFGEPHPDTITVYAIRRAAEAVADDDHIVGVLDFTGTTDPDATPPVRPLRYGGRHTDPDTHRLVMWSGKGEQDEARVRGELLPQLSGLHVEGFPALPAALPSGAAPGRVRAAVVTVARLSAMAVHKAGTVTVRSPRPVTLLFPGQGSQHSAMALGLYRREPVFTAAMDAVLSHMGDEGRLIREDWLTTGRPLVPVDEAARAQPLLFAVDYALGRTVLSWGVRPAALLGHSAGELVAATLAGVVSLPDAAAMMLARVRAAERIPAGGMLAVAATEAQLRPYLGADVAIAAVNAEQQVMLAGPAGPLAETERRLRADGYTAVAVPATVPFHSPAMAPAADELEERYRSIRFREPLLPLYSGYTGELMRPEEALSPRFWARQVTDPVYFKQALESLLAVEDTLLVEAGPRQILTAFARRHRAVRLGASAAVALLPARPGTREADRQSVLKAAARLWTEGHDLDPVALSRLWTWSDEADQAGGSYGPKPRLLTPALSS
ncbi:acyltransferase domain-containing protein [Streptomyces sp. CB03238]|uniref:acyltransferase domain-containing protein n=1 Tax=Streptomyces sp. CB03238 TaxID=1907777 RepID=UPI001F4E786D|nr:acyltransferase domain-containing protein [Streptomyces sp. CB03238]